MILALGAVVGVVAFWMLWKEVAAKNRPKKLSKVAAGAAGVLIAALLLLTATGRMHWLAALAAGALPFLRWTAGMLAGQAIRGWLGKAMGLGGFSPFQRTAAPGDGSTPNTSTVSTEDLTMTLDHASGAMDGEVLRGSRSGFRLAELDLDALKALHDEFQAADSRQLLGAYLDRRFPGWRDAGQRDASPATGAMDTQQALAVLGLAAGASEADIVGAHRRLMQKLHPDRGGTDYLAATLNRAKEVLLGGRNGA